MSCYNDAKQHPVLFGQLKEYNVLASIYEAFLAIQTATRTEEEQVKDLGNVLDYIGEQVRIGRLSRKLMHDRTILPSRFRHPVRRWLLSRYIDYRWAKARRRDRDVKSLAPNWLSRYLDS